MRRLWPTGGLWRHPDFLKLWSAETISQFGSQITGLALPLVAVLVHRGERLRGLRALRGRVPAVRAVRDPGRRLGRPAEAEADPRDRGHRPRRAPRLDPDRVRLRRPHHGQLYVVGFLVGHLHGLLRRRVPVVSPVARRAGTARRRQLEARDQPLRRADRRARARGRAHRHHRRARRDPPGRDQLPLLVGFPVRDPQARGAPRTRGGRAPPQHVQGGEGGTQLRARESLPPSDLDLHRHLQPLLQPGRGRPHRVRRPRARHVGARRSGSSSRSRTPGRCSPR